MVSEREKLFDFLYTRSFIYRDNPPFKLVSGRESPYYFDCKAATLDPGGCFLIGRLYFEAIREMKPDAIGGLTLGADPISISASLEAYRNGISIRPLIIRKEAKKHGTQKWIEGNLENVRMVVAVDDVITTGGSTLTAIERMRATGLEVIGAVVIIDREEGGRENIEKSGVPVRALYTRTEFDNRRLSGK
jgi:orotate phosphoribosyltransferase